MGDEITIRRSTEADCNAIRRLAALDSRHAPVGAAILGFVGDELRAAVGIETGVAVADPFHPTAELVELLRFRAAQRDGRGNLSGLLGLGSWRQAPDAA